MKISQATVKDNQINITKTKIISQANLTPECWNIQFWGITACQECEFLDTEECGGKRIRKLIQKGEYPRGGLADQRKK